MFVGATVRKHAYSTLVMLLCVIISVGIYDPWGIALSAWLIPITAIAAYKLRIMALQPLSSFRVAQCATFAMLLVCVSYVASVSIPRCVIATLAVMAGMSIAFLLETRRFTIHWSGWRWHRTCRHCASYASGDGLIDNIRDGYDHHAQTHADNLRIIMDAVDGDEWI